MKKVSTWRPAVEIKQSETDYKVKIQLPGVKLEDIDVELDNDFMTITAEIEEEQEEKWFKVTKRKKQKVRGKVRQKRRVVHFLN